MSDHRKLARLRRLERIRGIARQQALAEAGRAESTLAQLQALASRTEAMHGAYGRHGGVADGHALAHRYRFVEGLGRVVSGTRADAERAAAIADARAAEAARAERSRAAVEERARAAERAILRKAAERELLGSASGARKPVGTGLE